MLDRQLDARSGIRAQVGFPVQKSEGPICPLGLSLKAPRYTYSQRSPRLLFRNVSSHRDRRPHLLVLSEFFCVKLKDAFRKENGH
jgi:hypothetical protein